MTNREFIDKVYQLYVDAAKPTFPDSERVHRGRKHAVSGKLEDLFAHFLACNDGGRFRYFVDQPMSVAGRQFRPDVMPVSNDGTVSVVYDLKTDLGFLRKSFGEFCKNSDDLVKRLRSKSIDHWKDVDRLRFGDEFYIYIVVLSSGNVSDPEAFDRVIEKYQGLRLDFLSEGEHPNTCVSHGLEPTVIQVRHGGFERVLSALR